MANRTGRKVSIIYHCVKKAVTSCNQIAIDPSLNLQAQSKRIKKLRMYTFSKKNLSVYSSAKIAFPLFFVLIPLFSFILFWPCRYKGRPILFSLARIYHSCRVGNHAFI